MRYLIASALGYALAYFAFAFVAWDFLWLTATWSGIEVYRLFYLITGAFFAACIAIGWEIYDDGSA